MIDKSVRPRIAIGHVLLSGADLPALAAFYAEVGMRPVVAMEHMAIVELRGGTHIVISPGPAGQGELDLMVDDIDETREIFMAAGAEVSEIRRGNPHDRFHTTDPEGNKLVVLSSHVTGTV